MSEVQVYEGEGIDWQREMPLRGSHIATVTIERRGLRDIIEPCRVWVQHDSKGGGAVRFMGISPENPVSAFLNTMFSRANSQSTKAGSYFVFTVGSWHCKGCQVVSTFRDKKWDTINVNVASMTRRA